MRPGTASGAGPGAGRGAAGRRPALRPVATLWIGGALRWIDRLTLTALCFHGHEVTLYIVGEEPPHLPDGVILRAADELMPVTPLIGRFSPASIADMFRYVLMRDTEAIWVDTDAVPLMPLVPDDAGYLVGAEDVQWINNAVLRLPATSPALAMLNAACAARAQVPVWLPAERRAGMRPVPPGQALQEACRVMPNLLGPKGLTHALNASGEAGHALPPASLNPLPWWHAAVAFNPHGGTEGWLSEDSRVLHLFASRIPPPLLRRPAPPGSFLARLAARYGLSAPARIPVQRRSP